MKTSEQFESLLDALLSVRDSLQQDIPDSLLSEIVSAHVEEPDNPTIHRRVQQAIESRMDEIDASD